MNEEYQGDYNQGKDIMPNDIGTESMPDGTTYAAALGFIQYPSMLQQKPKYYVGYGSSEKEAKSALLRVMIEHLQRLI